MTLSVRTPCRASRSSARRSRSGRAFVAWLAPASLATATLVALLLAIRLPGQGTDTSAPDAQTVAQTVAPDGTSDGTPSPREASGGTRAATSVVGEGPGLLFSRSASESATLTGATLPGSCAAAACHGQPFRVDKRDWRNAHGVWSAVDPHRRAFEVLYSRRSVEIYRNLRQSNSPRASSRPLGANVRNPGGESAEVQPGAETAPAASTNVDVTPIDPADYTDFLEQRCIGCHATVPQGYSAPTERDEDSVASAPRDPNRLEGLLDGITCESCHVMPPTAHEWRDKHYLTDWPPARETALRSLLADGDLADLRRRDALCGSCHAGPKSAGDRTYDVTHDLIAAGHPRLAFEFATYLANYPKHWDEQADRARHERRTGGSYYVDAWRVGQEGSARRLTEQWSVRLSESAEGAPWPELSQFVCVDCHHAMRPLASRVTGREVPADRAASATRKAARGLPRPDLEAFARLVDLYSTRPAGARQLLERLDVVRGRLQEFSPPDDELLADVADLNALVSSLPPLDYCRPDQLATVGQLLRRYVPGELAEERTGQERTGQERAGESPAAAANKPGAARQLPAIEWQAAVNWLLAVDALAYDLSDHEAARALRRDIAALREALADRTHFGSTSQPNEEALAASIYDSPASFDAARVAPLFRRIADRLGAAELYERPSVSPSTVRP